jgi:hypothetical protein
MWIRDNRCAAAAALIAAALLLSAPAKARQESGARVGGPFDTILDTDVRDGYVYYRALKMDRAKLDTYVAGLGSASITGAPRSAQIAFWLNAYNAFVLRTVIDHYPISGRSKDYPPRSIRQIPGAFERLPHRAAGRTVTLDEIENAVLPAFGDPRVFFAIAHGSVGGGRLRSEAFTADRLETQLAEVAAECASRPECVEVDPDSATLQASAIFSWHERQFTDPYADKAPATFASRSPIERAILAYVQPKLLATEKEFLNRNQFAVKFRPFDWHLNDLTGRGGR